MQLLLAIAAAALLGTTPAPRDTASNCVATPVTGAYRTMLKTENQLVPALILYHPSRAVVFRALNILAKSGRVDFVPIADRLLDSPAAEIRAAALRARSTVQPDESVLRRAGEDPSPLVRATGIVGLIGGGWGAEDARQMMDDLLQSSSVETQVAFARAIERDTAGEIDHIRSQLTAGHDMVLVTGMGHPSTGSGLAACPVRRHN